MTISLLLLTSIISPDSKEFLQNNGLFFTLPERELIEEYQLQ